MLHRLCTIALLAPTILLLSGAFVSLQAALLPARAIAQATPCDSLLAISNQAIADVQTVILNAAPGDVEPLLQVATISEQASTDMQALELTDTQLQDYRTQFTIMYSDRSQAARNLVAAVGEQNSTAAQQAYEVFVAATNQEEPLINNVRTYCTQ